MSTKKSQLRSHHYCVFSLSYHLVLVTKHRRKCFTKGILERLNEISANICDKWSVDLVEFGGEADHIHLIIETYPSIDLSKFVNNLKTVSSRLTRKEFAEHLGKFYWKPVLWTRAYCILSVGGSPLEKIQQYIQDQDTPEK